jgi:hypothetical protein
MHTRHVPPVLRLNSLTHVLRQAVHVTLACGTTTAAAAARFWPACVDKHHMLLLYFSACCWCMLFNTMAANRSCQNSAQRPCAAAFPRAPPVTHPPWAAPPVHGPSVCH